MTQMLDSDNAPWATFVQVHSEGEAHCWRCREVLPLAAFSKETLRPRTTISRRRGHDPVVKSWVSGRCIDCPPWKEMRPFERDIQGGPEYRIVRSLIVRAKTRTRAMGLPRCDLDAHTRALHERVCRRRCEATGIALDIDGFGTRSPFAPSFDQIRAGAGYMYSNVRIVGVGYNFMRGTMPADEFDALARRFLGEWQQSWAGPQTEIDAAL